MAKRREQIGASMNDWANAFNKQGLFELGNKFLEGMKVKEKGELALKQLRLPHLKYIALPYQEFSNHISAVIKDLGAGLENCPYAGDFSDGRYFVGLVSDKWSSRLRKYDLTEAEVAGYIRTSVRSDQESDFIVRLARYFPNIYGGNLTIGSDEEFLWKLHQGHMAN